MNRKKKLKILIALLALLALAITALTIWIANEKKAVTIYDFSRTIEYDEKSNYALTSDDLTASQVLAADIKEEYITDPQEVIGKYITGTAYKGQHIMKNQVQTDPTYIEISGISELAEYRKLYLPINYQDGFAGDIKSGQNVDLLWTQSGSGYANERITETGRMSDAISYTHTEIFMQNVPIYQVYTAGGDVYKKKVTDPETLNKFSEVNTGKTNKKDSQNGAAPAYVALTVTIPQYEEIAARQQTGKISLVSRFDGSEDQESHGFTVYRSDNAAIYAGEGNFEFDPQINMDKDADSEQEDAMENGTVLAKKPGIYSFLRRMAMVDMTADQTQRFRSINTRYIDYMKDAAGTEWEINDPDSFTADDIMESFNGSGDKINHFMAWKVDVKQLSTELFGSLTDLPW